MSDTHYEELAAMAAKAHREANKRYSQAMQDSQIAAFRELVFTAAAAGIVTVEMLPSDQGDYMTISHAPDVDGVDLVDSDDLFEAMEDAAMDLPDSISSHWALLPGVDYVNSRRAGDSAGIDIAVAAPAAAEALREEWLAKAPEGVTAVITDEN